jgi:hypothetical protein
MVDSIKARSDAEKGSLMAKLNKSEELIQSLYSEVNTYKLQNQSLRRCSDKKDYEIKLQDQRWKDEFQVFRVQKDELQKTCKVLANKNSRVHSLLLETKVHNSKESVSPFQMKQACQIVSL